MDYLQLRSGAIIPDWLVIGIIAALLVIGIAFVMAGRSTGVAIGAVAVTVILVAAFILFVKGPLSSHDENVALAERSYGVKASSFLPRDGGGRGSSTLAEFVASPHWNGIDSRDYTYAGKGGTKVDVTVSIDEHGRMRIEGPDGIIRPDGKGIARTK